MIQIKTDKHNFNKPIVFTWDGLFLFMREQEFSMRERNENKFHIYEDAKGNIFHFDIELNNPITKMIFNPTKSHVIYPFI